MTLICRVDNGLATNVDYFVMWSLNAQKEIKLFIVYSHSMNSHYELTLH